MTVPSADPSGKQTTGCEANERPLYRVLAIDGGGIRGVIPAVFLTALEERTGRPISCLFDMLAGTSTGGILATCLAMPRPNGKQPQLSARNVLELYEKNARQIFRRPDPRELSVTTFLRSLFRPEYQSSGIESALRTRLNATQLSDALVELLITSYEIEQRTPYFFKRHRAKANDSRNHYLRDVARATSAAPTYFPPARVPSLCKNNTRYLVDGGVFANNPALCAYIEAKAILHSRKKSCQCGSACSCAIPKDILLVSIGTGETNDPICFEKAAKWGKARWVRPALDVMMDGMADAVDHHLTQLYGSQDGAGAYYRFQISLDGCSDQMDRIDRCNISALKRKGEQLLETESRKFTEVVEELQSQTCTCCGT